MAIEHTSICKKFLILCEGKDTEKFIINYLNSKALKADPRFSSDIQTFDFGGIDGLELFMQGLQNMEHFDEVQHILVIRDAERNVQKAENSVKKAFKMNGLPIPAECCEWETDDGIATAYVLMPSCNKTPVPGALEDLCWDILKENSNAGMKKDVQRYIDGVKQNYSTIRAHEHKSRLHVWLSSHDKYVSLKVGEAAQKGVFDWKSERLHSLRKLIEEGFKTLCTEA